MSEERGVRLALGLWLLWSPDLRSSAGFAKPKRLTCSTKNISTNHKTHPPSATLSALVVMDVHARDVAAALATEEGAAKPKWNVHCNG